MSHSLRGIPLASTAKVSVLRVYLVIEASRGIGYEIAKQLGQDPSKHVIATTRKPVDFGKTNVDDLVLDQTDSNSVNNAAAKVKEADVLIINAAMGEPEYLLSTSIECFQQYLETNVVGVHRVVNAFVPALKVRKTRKIVIISSISGSNTRQRGSDCGLQGPYAVTKAANNGQVTQYHNELYKDGFSVIALHPGWVATDMGTSKEGLDYSGAMPASKSAGDIIKRAEDLKHEDSGKFFVHDGTIMEW